MSQNLDRAAVEDLEAMMDRSLKIEASPPHWQPNFHSPHDQRTPLAASGYASAQGPPYFPGQSPPPRQPAISPTAIYATRRRVETQAVPSPSATTGMRASASMQSLGSHLEYRDMTEQQRQQNILRHQQAEQQRIEAQQRQRRLEQLQREQAEQELELQRLKRREQQLHERQLQEEQRLERQLLEEQRLEAQLREEQRQEQQLLEEQRQERQLEEQRLEQQYRDQQLRDQLHEQQLRDQLREQQLRDQLHEQQLRDQREQQLRDHEQQLHEQLHEQLTEQQLHEQLHDRHLQNQQYHSDRSHDHSRELEARALAEAMAESEYRAQNSAPVPFARPYAPASPSQAADAAAGAATMLQRTQDKHGNVTTRVVKKGVEDFDFKEELGIGSYSTVVAAQDKQTLRQYAVKILDKAHIIKEQKVKYVEIEKLTLNRLGDHPGIIRLYFTFQDRQSLYFVLDFAPNGELLNLIKRVGSLNEECARYYACQLLDAVDYMHRKGVVHRDLKPENILLDYKMRIKITDFGTAKLLDADERTGEYPPDTKATSFVGTAEYVSPELLVGKAQGKSTDLWAWGCILYQMIAAVPPFQGKTQYLTFQKIAKIQYSIPPGFPYVVRELLQHVLVKPQIRYTVREIKEHEFFAGQDWSSKALWGTPPPRLQPYKASVASMKPRPLASGGKSKVVIPARQAPSGRSTAAAAASASTASAAGQKQVFVPTASGLQAVNPTTLYGMPVYINNEKSASTTSVAAPPERRPSAGLGLRTKRSGIVQTTKPAPTSAYQQSQEKIEALRRRMQVQRQAGKPLSPVGTGSSASGHAKPASGQPVRPHTPSTPRVAESPQSSPRLSGSPLPQPPLSPLESQFSTLMVSAQERFLRVGSMSVFVSSHAPPQAPAPRAKPKHKSKDAASKAAAAASSSQETEEDDDDAQAYSYGDESLFSKLLASKMKTRLVLITTFGRLLVLGADDRKIQYEVPLGLPQIDVSEVPFQTGKARTTKIVIQTYNKVLTLDDPGQIGEWMYTIELSRRYYSQVAADQERSSFNAAAAAASAVAGRRR